MLNPVGGQVFALPQFTSDSCKIRSHLCCSPFFSFLSLSLILSLTSSMIVKQWQDSYLWPTVSMKSSLSSSPRTPEAASSTVHLQAMDRWLSEKLKLFTPIIFPWKNLPKKAQYSHTHPQTYAHTHTHTLTHTIVFLELYLHMLLYFLDGLSFSMQHL